MEENNLSIVAKPIFLASSNPVILLARAGGILEVFRAKHEQNDLHVLRLHYMVAKFAL
jgi:hypothetical protein